MQKITFDAGKCLLKYEFALVTPPIRCSAWSFPSLHSYEILFVRRHLLVISQTPPTMYTTSNGHLCRCLVATSHNSLSVCPPHILTSKYSLASPAPRTRSPSPAPLLSVSAKCILFPPRVAMVFSHYLANFEITPLSSSSRLPSRFLPGLLNEIWLDLEIGIPQPHFLSPVPSNNFLSPVARSALAQTSLRLNFSRSTSLITCSLISSHSLVDFTSLAFCLALNAFLSVLICSASLPYPHTTALVC